MSITPWQERPLAPFGVEIDARIDGELTAEQGQELAGLLRRHKLLVLRNQNLSEDQQAGLMAHLGPVLGATGEYRRLSSDGNLGTAQLTWHSDLSFTEEPFQAISLYALAVNDGQSWTAFVNGVDAARTLPADLSAQVENHDALAVISMIQTHRAVDYEAPEFLPQFTRPVLFPHPLTGELVLYVSDMQTARIEGLPREESDALLEQLFAHLYAEDKVYRHHWRNGDLVIWDNIATQHSRCDLTGMHPREMQRVCCATKSFFELCPQFSLDDPRIAAWGKGQVLDLEGEA